MFVAESLKELREGLGGFGTERMEGFGGFCAVVCVLGLEKFDKIREAARGLDLRGCSDGLDGVAVVLLAQSFEESWEISLFFGPRVVERHDQAQGKRHAALVGTKRCLQRRDRRSGDGPELDQRVDSEAADCSIFRKKRLDQDGKLASFFGVGLGCGVVERKAGRKEQKKKKGVFATCGPKRIAYFGGIHTLFLSVCGDVWMIFKASLGGLRLMRGRRIRQKVAYNLRGCGVVWGVLGVCYGK